MMDVAGKAAILVLIIGLGYGSKQLGWVAASDFPMLSRILLRVTLPCALATSFNAFDITPGLLYLVALGAAVVLTQQAAGFVLNRAAGRRGRAFGVLNVSSFNIGLFAMPYLGTFIGPHAIVYAALFDIGNSFMAAGIGYAWALTMATGAAASVVNLVKRLFSSFVFDTYLMLLVLGLARVKFPAPVLAFTSVVANANTFLAMFTIGVGLEIVLSRKKYVIATRHLVTRYVVSAAWLALVWFVLPLGREIKVIVCMLLFAPLAVMISAFTSEAELDVEASTFITSVSVLVGIVAMPLLAGVLG
jgi:malate permease and related proteins